MWRHTPQMMSHPPYDVSPECEVNPPCDVTPPYGNPCAMCGVSVGLYGWGLCGSLWLCMGLYGVYEYLLGSLWGLRRMPLDLLEI